MAAIVICGAGPGLSLSVARRYGRQGYRVVLVARREESLQQLAANLTAEGIAVDIVRGDLSRPEDMSDLASRIRTLVGDPEVLHYAPTTSQMTFVPAEKLTVDQADFLLKLLFESFFALNNEFLPAMKKKHGAAILTAQGTTALNGSAGMSGPGPAMAAQRNYLQSLGLELEEQGVFVGRLYISALIKNSAIYRMMEAEGKKIPSAMLVDPDDLAEKIWKMHQRGKKAEVVVPAWTKLLNPLLSSKKVRSRFSDQNS